MDPLKFLWRVTSWPVAKQYCSLPSHWLSEILLLRLTVLSLPVSTNHYWLSCTAPGAHSPCFKLIFLFSDISWALIWVFKLCILVLYHIIRSQALIPTVLCHLIGSQVPHLARVPQPHPEAESRKGVAYLGYHWWNKRCSDLSAGSLLGRGVF